MSHSRRRNDGLEQCEFFPRKPLESCWKDLAYNRSNVVEQYTFRRRINYLGICDGSFDFNCTYVVNRSACNELSSVVSANFSPYLSDAGFE